MEFPVLFHQKAILFRLTCSKWGKLGDSLQNHSTAKPNPTTAHEAPGGREVPS